MVMRLPVVWREGGSKIISPFFERLMLITPIYSYLFLSLSNIIRLSWFIVFSGSLTSIRNADSVFGFERVAFICFLGKGIRGLLIFMGTASFLFLFLLLLMFIGDGAMFSTIL